MERIITIQMDGGSWLCYDERFVDLAESEHFGFGDSPEEALAAYLATESRNDVERLFAQ